MPFAIISDIQITIAYARAQIICTMADAEPESPVQVCANLVFALDHCSIDCELVGVGSLNSLSHSKEVLPFLLQLLFHICLLPVIKTQGDADQTCRI